jgi:hypothetical protein
MLASGPKHWVGMFDGVEENVATKLVNLELALPSAALTGA